MNRFMKLADVISVTTISKSSIYAKMKDGTFPKSIKLSERSTVWKESDIHEWMEVQASNSNESK